MRTEQNIAKTCVIPDEDIWLSFQSGEDAAFNMLYARYADRVYGYLKLLLVSSPSQLDDLFQETWLIVFRHREKFHVSATGSFAGWLFRVAHNLAIGVLRKARRTTSIDDLSVDTELIEGFVVQPTQDRFERPSTDELMLKVVQTVEGLPLLLREVFVLSEFDRLSLEQISETLGITRTNAKVRLFRARRMIRETLSKELDFTEYEV